PLPVSSSRALALHVRVGPPPRASRSPYTTLFRSRSSHEPGRAQDVLHEVTQLHLVDRRDLLHRHHGHDDEQVALDHVLERAGPRSEEHTSELQSRENLVCRLLLEKKNDATDPSRA